MIDANRPKNQPADAATSENEFGSLFRDIAEIIKESRKQVQQTVNLAMVESYWRNFGLDHRFGQLRAQTYEVSKTSQVFVHMNGRNDDQRRNFRNI